MLACLYLIGAILGAIFGTKMLGRGKTEEPYSVAFKATWAGAFAVVGIFLVWLFTLVVNLYTDFLWYESVGFEEVWIQRLTFQWGTFFAVSVISFVALFINALFVDILRHDPIKLSKWEVLGTAALCVLIGWLYKALYWDEVIRYTFQQNFGVADPIYGRDMAFYAFILPMRVLVARLVNWLLVAAGIYFLGRYAYSYYAEIREENRDRHSRSPEQIVRESTFYRALVQHGSLLLITGFLLWAYKALALKKFSILIGTPGFVDINWRIPGYTFTGIAVLIATAFLVYSVFVKRIDWGKLAGDDDQEIVSALWNPIIAVLTPYVVSVIILGLLPGFVQWIFVNPNQLKYEREYIALRIEATRWAFALDQIQTVEFPYQPGLTPQELQQNDESLAQTRVMDWRPLLITNDNLQEIRPQYDFGDVDIDRYDGQLLMPSARELNQDQLPDQAKTWLNRKMVYTHGFGYTMAEVNHIADQGLPAYTVKDVPATGPEQLVMQEQRIYFGELTEAPVFVGTQEQEFDQPFATEVYPGYDGQDGISVGSFGRRLLFAISLDDFRLLTVRSFTEQTRLLMNRELSQRIPRIMPNLRYDSDPYIVAENGQIYWLQDAYTTIGNNLPFVEANEGVAYLRNPVKVVVDAYDGTITFFADVAEPVSRLWTTAYPDLFVPMENMPDYLRQHVRYPEGLFSKQAAMLLKYHITNPDIFYYGEDVWILPQETYQEEVVTMEPRFVRLRLPGEETSEFVEILPFTPVGKQNLVAWLAARMDGKNYGKLHIWTFPRNQTVLGPLQIEGLINQDPQISRDVTLWGQRGSRVVWGNLMTLPILGAENGTVVYVKPLFLQSEQSAIPALTRVIVLTGNRIIYESTLPAALTALYQGAGTVVDVTTVPTTTPPLVGTPAVEPDTTTGTLNPVEIYDEAQTCLEAGDLVCFAQKWEELGEALNR